MHILYLNEYGERMWNRLIAWYTQIFIENVMNGVASFSWWQIHKFGAIHQNLGPKPSRKFRLQIYPANLKILCRVLNILNKSFYTKQWISEILWNTGNNTQLIITLRTGYSRHRCNEKLLSVASFHTLFYAQDRSCKILPVLINKYFTHFYISSLTIPDIDKGVNRSRDFSNNAYARELSQAQYIHDVGEKYLPLITTL